MNTFEKRRLELRMSRGELVQRSGMSKKCVDSILNNGVEYTGMMIARSIARALNLVCVVSIKEKI